MQRRDILKIGAGALVAAELSSGLALADKPDNGPDRADGEVWSFIAVNDLHFHDAACGPWFERAVAAIKQSAPNAAFCLLGGDLADEGKAFQVSGALEAFKKLEVPLYSTPGNHDYATDTDRAAYDEALPGHANQSFLHRGWQFVGLDTTQGMRWDKTNIQQETFDWLDANLAHLDKSVPTVVWTHFPLGPGAHHRPLNADALLDKLAILNIRAIYSGHWHAFTEATWRGAACSTDRCCSRYRENHDGSKEKGWFVCTIRGDKIERRFAPVPA